jgi:hypothetical protein
MSQISIPGGGVVFQPARVNASGDTAGAIAAGAGVRMQGYTQQHPPAISGYMQQQPPAISGYIQQHPSEHPSPTSLPQQANIGTSQSPSQQPLHSDANDTSSLTAKVSALSEKAKMRWKQVFNKRKHGPQSSQRDPTGANAASAPHGSRFAPGLSDLQVALHTNTGALPSSCSTYTVQAEMTNTEFIVLTQQLMVVPPQDSISVACCHRLPPKIRQHVRLGSKIVSLSLLDYKSQLVQVMNFTRAALTCSVFPFIILHTLSIYFQLGMGLMS